MIVADTSFIVEAILRDARLLENETLITPDLTLYETVNIIWKHETLTGDLKDSSHRIDLLQELVSATVIELVRPDERLLKDTYALSTKHKVPVYDTVFVALALELGVELKTFDSRQASIMSKERSGASNRSYQ